jgi:hypothetical protein
MNDFMIYRCSGTQTKMREGMNNFHHPGEMPRASGFFDPVHSWIIVSSILNR